ncbi:unnamed protein product [Arabidopsis thaliana]|uniref:C2 domain-containing protein n=1 Tax=Arabidopsis thaliana TaxID=3702 RepID=A0A5S9YDD3_ARATH|nr:unnamed protein product [Arabidopsis thaliana]
MAEHDFSLKETCPKIGGRRSIPGGDMLTSSFDLVERMTFLYIRIVKARALPSNDLFVEVTIGRYKGRTKRSTNPYPNLEFHEVFAFNSDRLQGNMLEVTMKVNEEEIIGQCRFEVAEIPTRIPPDSPLAPQWDRLEDRNANRFGEEVMVSVWMGTQADEVCPEAWHSDSATVTGENAVIVRSKVYLSPRLWYLRVNVIEAQILVLLQGNRTNPEVLVKGFVGNVVVRSRVSQSRTMSPVLERGYDVERRVLPGPVPALWYNLERVGDSGFAGRIHLRVSLDGGYHVLDESIQYSSDYRASMDSNYWCIGARSHQCIWFDSDEVPRWSRHHRCILRGEIWAKKVPGNSNGAKDSRIGKIRIRLSTLETERIYTHSYPLIVLKPDGVKKMGEIQLAIRFSCISTIDMLQKYSEPLLPEMHYLTPLSIYQLDSLRHQATHILCLKLGWSEPPLGRDVIEYMLDFGSNIWSLRRGRANFERIVSFFTTFIDSWIWFDSVCKWKSPIRSALPDELDEEFDGFPSARSADLVRKRYDRLRGIAGRMMMVLGDLATQGERVKNLLSWRDPRATFLFSMFCLVACGVIFLVSMKLLMTLLAFYVMRHPRFRIFDIPSVPQNFFRRLPSRADSML